MASTHVELLPQVLKQERRVCTHAWMHIHTRPSISPYPILLSAANYSTGGCRICLIQIGINFALSLQFHTQINCDVKHRQLPVTSHQHCSGGDKKSAKKMGEILIDWAEKRSEFCIKHPPAQTNSTRTHTQSSSSSQHSLGARSADADKRGTDLSC